MTTHESGDDEIGESTQTPGRQAIREDIKVTDHTIGSLNASTISIEIGQDPLRVHKSNSTPA